jgi:YfiH family protein
MWTLDAAAALPLWRPAGATTATLAFSTRRGGVSQPPFDTLNLGRSTADSASSVEENRRRVLAALGLDPARIVTAGQVHGRTVSEVFEPGHAPECDALVTRRPGLGLAVSTADCLPLLYVAPGGVAVAHSGWRGTAAGMPRAALEATCRVADVPPGSVTVHLGPCIRDCCYEVGPEVARRFPAAVVRRVGAATRLDLAAAARLQLLEAGVPSAAVFDTGGCTACRPDWYYSYRRDGIRSGRHWAVVSIGAGLVVGKRNAQDGQAL